MTVLVSVFLFSLEGDEEDRDLVIAKGLDPQTSNRIQCGLMVILAFHGYYKLFKIATKARLIFMFAHKSHFSIQTVASRSQPIKFTIQIPARSNKSHFTLPILFLLYWTVSSFQLLHLISTIDD